MQVLFSLISPSSKLKAWAAPQAAPQAAPRSWGRHRRHRDWPPPPHWDTPVAEGGSHPEVPIGVSLLPPRLCPKRLVAVPRDVTPPSWAAPGSRLVPGQRVER